MKRRDFFEKGLAAGAFAASVSSRPARVENDDAGQQQRVASRRRLGTRTSRAGASRRFGRRGVSWRSCPPLRLV